MNEQVTAGHHAEHHQTAAAVVAAAVAEPASKKPKKDREVTVVQMADGRSVEFVGTKKKMMKESLFDDATGDWIGTRFDFRDGQTFTFEPTRLPEKFGDGTLALATLAAHGLEQKLGDQTAGVETASGMFDEVEGLAGQLYDGSWSKERTGGGFAGTSILARALVESTGKPLDVVKTFLKSKDADTKKAMRRSAQLKHIVDRLEAEEAAKSDHVDVDAVLGELEAIA